MSTPPTPVTADIRAAIASSLSAMGLEGAPDDAGSVHLERPANPDHGDFSTNAALALAKRNGRNPRELAAELVDGLEAAGGRARHGDGGRRARVRQLPARRRVAPRHGAGGRRAGADYGRSEIGRGRRVMVEFVSANPTGPVHAGHARGATYGDSLARLLAFTGHERRRASSTSTTVACRCRPSQPSLQARADGP